MSDVDAGGPTWAAERLGEDATLSPGARAGEYVVEQLIGRGGFGAVYRAVGVEDRRPVAIKVLHRVAALDPVLVERFRREVETVNRIGHPHLAEIHGLGRLKDGRPFYAMELLEGRDLEREVTTRGALSPLEAYELVAPLCSALEAAHAAGVVHRDLKPENVFIPFTRRVKLIDFGVAKLLRPDAAEPGLTATGLVLGTPRCMAPEQIRGEPVDARTDVYGLGAILFFALTGRYPFHGTGEQLMAHHLDTPAPPPSRFAALTPAVDAVVLRCLAKQPAARFQSARELDQALRAAILGDPALARPDQGVAILAQVVYLVEADDDTLVEADGILADTERELVQAGYQVVLHTALDVLGARRLPADPAGSLAAREAATALAERMQAAARRTNSPRVRPSYTVRTGEVHVRDGRAGIVGGPLVELRAWPQPHEAAAVTQNSPAVRR